MNNFHKIFMNNCVSAVAVAIIEKMVNVLIIHCNTFARVMLIYPVFGEHSYKICRENVRFTYYLKNLMKKRKYILFRNINLSTTDSLDHVLENQRNKSVLL